jgi:hypothetical protein
MMVRVCSVSDTVKGVVRGPGKLVPVPPKITLALSRRERGVIAGGFCNGGSSGSVAATEVDLLVGHDKASFSALRRKNPSPDRPSDG